MSKKFCSYNFDDRARDNSFLPIFLSDNSFFLTYYAQDFAWSFNIFKVKASIY